MPALSTYTHLPLAQVQLAKLLSLLLIPFLVAMPNLVLWILMPNSF